MRFRNTSHSPCLLAGFLNVTAFAPGKPDVRASDGSFFDFGHEANLNPGADTTLLGIETDTLCAARPGGGGGGDSYNTVRVQLPSADTITATVPGDGLDVTCGLHITHFFDPDYHPS